MADMDHAILLGISNYSSPDFQTLEGPSTDVELFRQWLLDKDGGAVPEKNIKFLTSPALDQQPKNDARSWAPTAEQFLYHYDKLTIDENDAYIRREGARLYLYFSGHGFSERNDMSTGAALFVAGASRSRPLNIHGTAFAWEARDLALFDEIVLIMDCCRDSETALRYASPGKNQFVAELAANVRVLAIYGSAKGGKAQERKIAERGNKTCSLLTHALLKALTDATPDEGSRLSSTSLRNYVNNIWVDICAGIPADTPRFVLPEGEDVFFKAGNKGLLQNFVLSSPPLPGTMLTFYLGSLNSPVAQCVFAQETVSIENPIGSIAISLSMEDLRFALRLKPGFYKIQASTGAYTSAPFEVTGERDVTL
jgi:Caspase domain.